jgi:hypothetical protein
MNHPSAHHGERLADNLREVNGLLRKFGHYGQAAVLEKILASLETPDPDYGTLAGISMWGGAGAVWDVTLASLADEAAFRRAMIRIAEEMRRLGIATSRSDDIAKIFKGWLDKGV